MKNKDIIVAVGVGLTLASSLASFGLALALYETKKRGVIVRLPPPIGNVEIRFDNVGTTGVVLPSSAQSVLAVLPAMVVLSGMVGTVAAAFLIEGEKPPSTAAV